MSSTRKSEDGWNAGDDAPTSALPPASVTVSVQLAGVNAYVRLLSLVLMLVAKVVTVLMPYTFKWATDALVAASSGQLASGAAVPWLIGAPVLATLLYGAARIAMTTLAQVRGRMAKRRPSAFAFSIAANSSCAGGVLRCST